MNHPDVVSQRTAVEEATYSSSIPFPLYSSYVPFFSLYPSPCIPPSLSCPLLRAVKWLFAPSHTTLTSHPALLHISAHSILLPTQHEGILLSTTQESCPVQCRSPVQCCYLLPRKSCLRSFPCSCDPLRDLLTPMCPFRAPVLCPSPMPLSDPLVVRFREFNISATRESCPVPRGSSVQCYIPSHPDTRSSTPAFLHPCPLRGQN